MFRGIGMGDGVLHMREYAKTLAWTSQLGIRLVRIGGEMVTVMSERLPKLGRLEGGVLTTGVELRGL